MIKTIEVIYENGRFGPLQNIDLPEKSKLMMKIKPDGLYELIVNLSWIFGDIKEDPLTILLDKRR